MSAVVDGGAAMRFQIETTEGSDDETSDPVSPGTTSCEFFPDNCPFAV
jgi:hypothetical protein